MTLYTTKDIWGRTSIHFASNRENAIQAHIHHFGITIRQNSDIPKIISEEDIPKSFKKYVHNVCKSNECRRIASFKIKE